jgi:hypothetical protein
LKKQEQDAKMKERLTTASNGKSGDSKENAGEVAHHSGLLCLINEELLIYKY